ncbi:MAG TPA: type IV toxin-antitoxin system AbiEi family antitoxin [Tepidisphaeraceae bacterium]|nr:type IV toxin-antitoxin system AbiEi family antitoxin [Tepidisphaeraceae bacterium]
MKSQTDRSLLKQAEAAIRTCLADIPFSRIEDVTVERGTDDSRNDLEISARFGKLRKRLLIEAKSSGQPRFARQAATNLRLLRQSSPSIYGIFAAPFITPETGEQLAEQDIGYVDFAGNCRLCFDSVYIRREGQTNRFTEKRDLGTLYSPRAESALRVLLGNSKRSWKVQELAAAASVSLGLVSNVKRLLEAREWVTSSDEGMKLAQPRKLLEEWRGVYRLDRNRRYDFFTLDPIATIEQKLADACKRQSARYALAAFSAAARYAPSVRYQRVFAYVDADIGALAKTLSLKSVDSGANVTLMEPYDQSVYLGSREVQESTVTSPPQTYLDLFSLRGRGEEAADFLLSNVLEPAW